MKAKAKTTIIVATYPGDNWLGHIKKILPKLGYPYILVNEKKKGTFAENNNEGARQAKTDYVLFLNSDTNPRPGFLEEMEKVLDQNKQFCIVGAKLLFMKDMSHKIKFEGRDMLIEGKKGLVQHAGIRLNKRLLPMEFGRLSKPDHPDVCTSSLVAATTGACMLVRRKEFLDIGGFDEKFKNGWEDTDLCLRYLEKKKMTFYQADAVVEHFMGGAALMGRYDNEDSNFKYWFSKWHRSKRIYKHFVPGYKGGEIKLDVGCGGKAMDGFIGVDLTPSDGVSMLIDLSFLDAQEGRFFFADSIVDEIACHNVLHLIPNTVGAMNEFHRILHPDAWLTLTVPHATSWTAWASPFTKRAFVPETFLEYFKADRLKENQKFDNQLSNILPWHIESVDGGTVPPGVNSFDIQREIVVKMKPLK